MFVLSIKSRQIEINEDGTVDPAIERDNLDVLIHEIGHVLVLSSNHYRNFRYASGLPRTFRQFSRSTVTCVRGEKKNTILPSKNTLDFFTDDSGNR